MATFAKEFELTRPVMTESNIYEIEDAYHPIQRLCVDQFIPNTMKLDGNYRLQRNTKFRSGKHIHILTGPNNSGKSILMKSMGLIVYLAHIGSV